MKGILISAMLQSQQTWLPEIKPPIPFQTAVTTSQAINKCIAHCLPGDEKPLLTATADDNLVLIGPEGDFTSTEIGLALSHDYRAVTLGHNRLRTETAGIVAVTLLASSGNYIG